MTEFPTVRVAAIQATPVILDADDGLRAKRCFGAAGHCSREEVLGPLLGRRPAS
jgi:hypothetical protein